MSRRELEVANQLFVHAAIATEIGVLFMGTSVVLALSGSGDRIDFVGARVRPFEAVGAFAGAFGAIGFLALPFAIALYVDGDSRRDAIDRLSASLRIGRSGIELAGRFP
ncbi:MAG: hypothetical protein AB8I08_34940 [Sandaracinaceae bacterium]